MTSMTIRRMAYAAGFAASALSTLAFSSVAVAQAEAPPSRQANAGAKDVSSTGEASPIAESYPNAAIGDGTTSGGYNQSRWAEDWSKLRDPKKRKDIVDQLKFISIAGDGDVYLTLSGKLPEFVPAPIAAVPAH